MLKAHNLQQGIIPCFECCRLKWVFANSVLHLGIWRWSLSFEIVSKTTLPLIWEVLSCHFWCVTSSKLMVNLHMSVKRYINTKLRRRTYLIHLKQPSLMPDSVCNSYFDWPADMFLATQTKFYYTILYQVILYYIIFIIFIISYIILYYIYYIILYYIILY